MPHRRTPVPVSCGVEASVDSITDCSREIGTVICINSCKTSFRMSVLVASCKSLRGRRTWAEYNLVVYIEIYIYIYNIYSYSSRYFSEYKDRCYFCFICFGSSLPARSKLKTHCDFA